LGILCGYIEPCQVKKTQNLGDFCGINGDFILRWEIFLIKPVSFELASPGYATVPYI
jgi:hypothetical protein